MTTVRHLLVTLPTAAASPADDARLAGVLALLRRRARTPIVVLAADPARTRRAHPDVDVRPAHEFEMALCDCDALVVAGTVHSEADFEIVARRILTARLLGVPAALVAVEIGAPGTVRARAWLAEVLANVESISAAEAGTAARVQALRGRRVETAAAPELVLEPDAVPRRGVLVEAALFEAPAAAGLRDALRGFEPYDLKTLSATGSAPGTDGNWRAWWQALSSADVLVTADPATAISALACGTVPVFCGDAEAGAVLWRIGLGNNWVAPLANSSTWTQALSTARSRAGRPLATRVAPLRALGWRALGPLADAGRAVAWSAAGASPPTRALVAECCATLAHSRVACGDSAGALQLLEAQTPALGREPAWVRARARLAALLGQDRDAVRLLENGLEHAPLDAAVRAELAQAQLRAGDPAAAQRTWSELARLVPSDAAPWSELATLALLAGDGKLALRCFAEALTRDPAHAGVRRAVAAYFVTDPSGANDFWRTVPGAAPPAPAVAGRKAPAV